MKTLKISILFLAFLFIGVFSTQSTYARKPVPQQALDMTQLNKLIKKSIKYPDFTLNDKEDGGEINVIFTLANDGKIKIEKVNAPTQRMEEYVTKELSDLSANYVIHSDNQKYSIKFRFNYY